MLTSLRFAWLGCRADGALFLGAVLRPMLAVVVRDSIPLQQRRVAAGIDQQMAFDAADDLFAEIDITERRAPCLFPFGYLSTRRLGRLKTLKREPGSD